MRFTCKWLQRSSSNLIVLALLVLALPVLSRLLLGWSHAYGHLSDLAVGVALLVCLHQRSWLLAVPALLTWCVFSLSTAELVNAVGRMPEPADLQFLTDAQFISHSTQGGGLSHPFIALAMAALIALYLALRYWQLPRRAAPLSNRWLILPLTLLGLHAALQLAKPSVRISAHRDRLFR